MLNTRIIMFYACMNGVALFTYVLTVVSSGVVTASGFRCPRPVPCWRWGWRSLCAGAVVVVLTPALRRVVGFRLWSRISARPVRWCRLCVVGRAVGGLLSSLPFLLFEFFHGAPLVETYCFVAAAHLALCPWFGF